MRADATSYTYLHVIAGTALSKWKETYLKSVQEGAIPAKWLMRHGAYSLPVPKEAAVGDVGFSQLRALAYKDAGDLDKSALVLFQLTPGTRWDDPCDASQEKMRRNWNGTNSAWDDKIFGMTRGRSSTYMLAAEARFLTKNGLAGTMSAYPVVQNARQVEKAIFFVPEDGNPNSHRRFEAFPSRR